MTALSKNKTPPTAMCRCGAPLICTLAFRKYEFYCLDCGSLYGWLEPIAKPTTPTLDKRVSAYRDEWQENASGLLGGGVMKMDCSKCGALHEPHINHATAEEIKAHEEAQEWLKQRRKK